jgi:hypothetical protein
MNAWLTKVDPRAHTRWLLVAMICSLLAAVGMVVAVPDIDRHPVMFAFSMTWVIGGFVGLVTRNWLLGMDPWRCRFASWEREGRVYRYVGIEAFRWSLRQTPLGWLNPALRMTARKADLEHVLRQMNFAEGAHLIGGVSTLALACGYAVTGHVWVGLTFAVITVLVHFYPMILQRWNRGRMVRVIQRLAPESARIGTAEPAG